MKAAASIAKRLEEDGLQLAGLQPTAAVRTLLYADLSAICDAIVVDIHKRYPDAFSDENPQGMYPTYLKFYLMIGIWDFLRRYASFTFVTGTPQIPTTVGYTFPSALIAWLSYLVPYQEGGSVATIKYVFDAAPSTGTNPGLVGTGSPTVTDISASAFYTVDNYIEDSATREAIRRSAVIGASDLGTFWSTFSDGLSTKLQGLDYPTMPMPEMWGKPAPDASAWTKPHLVGNGSMTMTNVMRIGNSFARWHEEIALLYLSDTQSYSGVNAHRSTRPLPRLTRIYGVDSSGAGLQSGVFASCQRAKENFVMLMRFSGSYEPGKPIFSHLSFCGEKLRTLNCNPRPVNLYRLKWASMVALDQLINNTTGGITIDSTLVWAYQLCVRYAVAARTRLTQVGYQLYSSTNALETTSSHPISTRWHGDVRLPIPIALLANDYGAVVQDGELQWPMIEDWGDFWFKGYTFPAVNNVWRFDDPVVTSSSWTTTSLKWQNVTLNAAWIAAYTGVVGYISSPFYSADRIINLVARALGSGAGFGRGDLSYQVSDNPRGGASMVATCNFALTLGADSVTDVGSYTSPTLKIYPIGGIYANVQISGEELGMAYLLGAVRSFSNSEYQTARNACTIPTSMSADSIMLNFVAPGCSNGGVVVSLLAEAFKRIHSVGGSFIYGDQQLQDTCLWDSMKGVLGTATRVLNKVAPIAAGVGCNIVVPGSGAVCSGVAKMATQAILDSHSIKTNRQSFATVTEAEAALVKEVRHAEAAVRQPGMPVGNASKPKRPIEAALNREIDRFAQSTRRDYGPKKPATTAKGKKKAAKNQVRPSQGRKPKKAVKASGPRRKKA